LRPEQPSETGVGVGVAARHNDAVTSPEPTSDPTIERVRFDERGLVPAIAQQHGSGEVLMLAWMDAEALRRTIETRRATYWSRSRREYWVKGDTSGHVQHVREVRLDCDGDTVLLTVEQTGAACHTGERTCFDADVLLADREGAA
jgi:phosphoribosyl-AMP cyclohydrolase